MKYKEGQKFRTNLAYIWQLPLGSVVTAAKDGSSDEAPHFMEWEKAGIKFKRTFAWSWLDIIEEDKK